MDDQLKRLRLRYPDACATCVVALPAGAAAMWDRVNRQAYCLGCGGRAPVELDAGIPGDSLEREYRRRARRREERIRRRFPRIGGFMLAVTPEPVSTQAFARGAEGERRIAARLERLCGDEALFLPNRRRGNTARSGDIDHIAVAASGIYVIDAKNYKGAKVRVRRSGGIFTARREQLIIRGRDRTHLVNNIDKQLVAVQDALGPSRLQVTALFCFLDAERPLFEKLTVSGVRVLGPRGTSKLLRRPGPLSADQRRELWERLARALPPA